MIRLRSITNDAPIGGITLRLAADSAEEQEVAAQAFRKLFDHDVTLCKVAEVAPALTEYDRRIVEAAEEWTDIALAQKLDERVPNDPIIKAVQAKRAALAPKTAEQVLAECGALPCNVGRYVSALLSAGLLKEAEQ